MKELLLEFVDENITSLHFSYYKRKQDLGVQQKYIRVLFGQFSHVSRTENKAVSG